MPDADIVRMWTRGFRLIQAQFRRIGRSVNCRSCSTYAVGICSDRLTQSAEERGFGQDPTPAITFADAIVVAGMDGALPSVVGLVSCPVIAVPTSIGYGASFGGIAALLTMLNACSAGVTVVNIDAGFKGGYVAALIARGARRGG